MIFRRELHGFGSKHITIRQNILNENRNKNNNRNEILCTHILYYIYNYLPTSNK